MLKFFHIFTFVVLSSCDSPERFESHHIAFIEGDLLSSGGEFSIPQKTGDLVAISGRLVGVGINYRDFLATFTFDLRLDFESGRTMNFKDLRPREVSWHGTDQSFVVLSDINESIEDRVTRVVIMPEYDKQKIESGDSVLRLEIFASVISE